MNTSLSRIPLVLIAGLIGTAGLCAQAPQVQFPAASPACTLKQRVGLTDIEVVYSRPGVKDRQIFGGLVAYGEVWRTGANSATKISFSTPVKLNGANLAAGTYSLFTIPGESEWTVIINENPEQWGAYRYDASKDVLRVKAKPVKLAESMETFTIGINDIRDESATLNLVWEKTRVPVKIEVDLKSTLVPQIEAVMASPEPRKPYFQAAMFYYDHNIDLQKARAWADAAVAEREAFFTVHLKAKILAKLGDKKGAIEAANRSIELAKQANDSAYIKLNNDLIAGLR